MFGGERQRGRRGRCLFVGAVENMGMAKQYGNIRENDPSTQVGNMVVGGAALLGPPCVVLGTA